MEELLNALKPILRAVDINDSDTLSMHTRDDKILWAATGSWSGGQAITLGDLRAVAKAAAALRARP